MQMSPEDRQKALEHIVFERYMPAFNMRLARFIQDFAVKQKQATELSLKIGLELWRTKDGLEDIIT